MKRLRVLCLLTLPVLAGCVADGGPVGTGIAARLAALRTSTAGMDAGGGNPVARAVHAAISGNRASKLGPSACSSGCTGLSWR